MKILKRSDVFPLISVVITCAIVSVFTFDKVYRGQADYTTNECSQFLQTQTSRFGLCDDNKNSYNDYGWPISTKSVEIVSGSSKPHIIRRNYIEIDEGIYLSYNVIILILAGAGACLLYLKYIKSKLDAGLNDNLPIISSYDLLSEGDVHSINNGEIAGYKYNLLFNKAGRTMMNVSLRHNSKIHLVALGVKSDGSLPFTENLNSRLSELTLEGDFPSYFKVFCTPGKENEVLQILEPVTMQYLAEFCKSYQLEIFMDTVYVSKGVNAVDSFDSTTLIQDTKELMTYHGKLFDRLGT